MADYLRNIVISWSRNDFSIQYNVEMKGNIISFQGEARLPMLIKFAYQVENQKEVYFSPAILDPFLKDLIVDALMTDFESYGEVLTNGN